MEGSQAQSLLGEQRRRHYYHVVVAVGVKVLVGYVADNAGCGYIGAGVPCRVGAASACGAPAGSGALGADVYGLDVERVGHIPYGGAGSEAAEREAALV